MIRRLIMKLRISIALLLLLLSIFSLSGNSYAQARPDEIYIIGVVEPLNKTDQTGHIDFPYYGEVMRDILSSSANNYIIKILDERDLRDAGYRYSCIKPDVDLQPDQIRSLCDKNRLDAVLTGRIKVMDRFLEPRFLEEAGRKMNFEMEGLLYARNGQQVWCKTVTSEYEFIREKGKFKPPLNTQLANFYADMTKALAQDLIGRIGTRLIDREPPTIEFENIRSGDKIKTTCIILKGKVSDKSGVDSIVVNGQIFPVPHPQKEIEMFYPVKVPHGIPGQQLHVIIEARDIYGFSYARELNLKWDKSVKGIVTSINKDSVSVALDPSDMKRVPIGTGFYIFSVDDFRDPLSPNRMKMFTTEEIGPAVVVNKFPNKSVVQVKFLKNQDKLMDQVKKDDIVK
jgi:hypothetical protein